MPTVLGLDIGGANLKAAHANGECESQPFALWREPAQLAQHLDALLAAMPTAERLAITMTGELCDCFETKRQGVNHILDAVEAVVGPRQVRVWSTTGAFLTLDAARENHMQVAAANWHAQATWLARRFAPDHGLLIDTGSTTTDIIPFGEGRVRTRGTTDTTRLANGELVYVGGIRTSLMALPLPEDATFQGIRIQQKMAEHFADMGDVRLLNDAISEQPSRCDTADGRPRTRTYAAARLLRMVGSDLDTATLQDAAQLAEQFWQSALTECFNGLMTALRVHPETNCKAGDVIAFFPVVSGSCPDIPKAMTQTKLWICNEVEPQRDHTRKPAFMHTQMTVDRRYDLAAELGPQAAGAACAVALAELGQGDLWDG